MTKSILVLLGFVFVAQQSWGALTRWSVAPGDRVQLSVGRANVQVQRANENTHVNLQTSGGCREIQSETAAGRLDLREAERFKLRSDSDVCTIQLLVPAAQSVSVHVLEGALSAQKLSGDVLLHLQKGNLILRDGSGGAQVHVQKGNVLIQDYNGRVRMDVLQAPVQLKNLQGDLDMQALAGEHVIEKSKGNFKVTQAQGSVKIVGGSGVLQFESNRAALTTDLFSGRIEGQSQEGAVNLKLAAESDVNLKTQAGRVTVQAPAGASLNLATQEGDLIVPSYMSVARTGAAKSVRGRLRGEGGKASVMVRSQEGSIFIK